MENIKVNRSILPDWYKCKAVAFVYPSSIEGRKYLCPFYDKLLTYIPADIDIKLLVKDISLMTGYEEKCRSKGIRNNIELLEFPDLADIWIRDFAPLTEIGLGLKIPVKFTYDPSYIKEKDKEYAEADNKVGSLLGKKLINEGEHSIEFTWDMGNLTHNGNGTAIISNQLIVDNKSVSIEQELKPVIGAFCSFNKIIFVPVEPEDETGHVDGMVRFIDEKTLVIGRYPVSYHCYSFMENLARDLVKQLGDDYKIIRMDNAEPEDYVSEGLGSAVGNHVNFLRINNYILFPYYGDAISKEPFEKFQRDLKEHCLEIVLIIVEIPELIKLARKGGVLNCISWQVFE
jgi:agmatine/peptidylarginine deiminase